MRTVFREDDLARLVAVVVLVATVLVWQHRPIQAPVVLYLTEAENAVFVPQSAPEKLAGEALLVLAGEFQQARFFAAFAAGPNGHYYWVSRRHSPQDARRDALAMCQDCKIIAERGPKGFRADYAGVTLSQVAASGADGAWEPWARDKEVFYALAPDGSWAVQGAQDGVLPGLSVLSRCREFMHSRARPLAMGPEDCTLYHGPVYGVGKTG
jgi:hypothetical protein